MSTKAEIRERLREKVRLLPDEPGVYRFLDESGEVIYVGKAKSLRKRVASYFLAATQLQRKVAIMVSKAVDLEHTVVFSESDALLLENNMIKSLKPRYNILLRDDKSYPWIVVRNEPYPRVLSTRRVVKDGSTYFGPYSSSSMQKMLLDMVVRLYSIRRCSLRLSQEGIRQGKFDLCLEYHIGNCKGPCVGKITWEEYQEDVQMARSTLKGNMREAESYLKEKMIAAATDLLFEKAQKYKERIEWLEGYESRSVIVSPTYSNMDIFYLMVDGSLCYCNYMYVKQGAVIYSYTLELKLAIEESESELLPYAINTIMERLDRKLSPEVVVQSHVNEGYFEGVNFTVPQRGDKLKLLELAQKNCRIHRLERLKQIERVDPELHTERLMSGMKADLMLDVQPRHIECFDNSNIQGKYPVSSCVVFRDGKPSKKEYRHFNIKSVVGIDDFASMKETLTRRYSRLLEEGGDLPDLIVVDGGKGQLSSAYDVLVELGIQHKVPIIGLAKRLEEIFYPGESIPHILQKSGQTLKVLMHIRDEAHRFGITFHRNRRSKGALVSSLDGIEGLGSKSIAKLLTRFKSAKKVREASLEELAEVVGKARAEKIIEHFKE